MSLTPEQVDEICLRLSEGNSLRKIAREMEIPESTVRYSLSIDEDAFAQSARARELGCDALADECIDIADDTEQQADQKRIRIDTRIRLIGKWSQRYNEKTTHEHTGKDGAPIRFSGLEVTIVDPTTQA